MKDHPNNKSKLWKSKYKDTTMIYIIYVEGEYLSGRRRKYLVYRLHIHIQA